MSVAVHITPQHMSKADYEQLISELKDDGMNDPEGRTFHAAYGEDDVHIFEVWNSREEFEAHADSAYARLLGASVDVGPLHNPD